MTGTTKCNRAFNATQPLKSILKETLLTRFQWQRHIEFESQDEDG